MTKGWTPSDEFVEGFVEGAVDLWEDKRGRPAPASDAEDGMKLGRFWAKDCNGTSDEELVRLKEAFLASGSVVPSCPPAASTCSVAELVYFTLSPDDVGDRVEARLFWADWAKDQYPSDLFAEGFVRGALGTCDQVKSGA
jgi:hypothetical protein